MVMKMERMGGGLVADREPQSLHLAPETRWSIEQPAEEQDRKGCDQQHPAEVMPSWVKDKGFFSVPFEHGVSISGKIPIYPAELWGGLQNRRLKKF